MDDLLTTRQLQEMLQVDRITIYRMLNDGRLRGFKVGGQWRFSRREIEAWLQQQQSYAEGSEAQPPSKGQITPSPQALPLSCMQAIQSICAEALDIASVTVDLDGDPLTEVSNSTPFCDLILSSAKGRRRCQAAWQAGAPQEIHTCHAGLLCASVPIWIGDRWVATTAACQFASAGWPEDLSALALELGLPAEELDAAVPSVRVVSPEFATRVTRLLQRMVDTFSEIGEERLSLLSRLRQIAQVSNI